MPRLMDRPACPQCHTNDKVRKIADVFATTTNEKLKSLLAPPVQPEGPTRPYSDFNVPIMLVVGAVGGLVTYAVYSAVARLLMSNDPNISVSLPVIVIVVGIAVSMGLYVWLSERIRGLIQPRTYRQVMQEYKLAAAKFEADYECWEKAAERWNQIYCCNNQHDIIAFLDDDHAVPLAKVRTLFE